MPYVFNVLGFSEIFINSEKVKLWFQWKIARLKKKRCANAYQPQIKGPENALFQYTFDK